MKFLFDSHAHLNFEAFKDDYPQVIKRCLDNKVWLINVGSRLETSRRAVAIAEKYPQGVWAAVGLHPIHVGDENFDPAPLEDISLRRSENSLNNPERKNSNNPFMNNPERLGIQKLRNLPKVTGFDYQKYLILAKNSSKVVAIGETGLDYYRITDPKLRIKQKEIFLKHLELAQELNKPLIIHCREAQQDLLDVLNSKSYILNSKLPGVIHCFSGNRQQAKQYLEMGFLLGFTGVITYSSSYDAIIKNLPLEKILIETDCPYLAPVPHRGQRNEPIYVKYVAQKIAEIQGLSLEKVAEQTFQNTLQLFGL